VKESGNFPSGNGLQNHNELLALKEKAKKLIYNTFPILSLSLQDFLNLLTFESIGKDTVFVKCGERDEKEYFLLDGICRFYAPTCGGGEATLAFFIQNSLISPNFIRTANGISNVNIQSLTDIQIASLPASTLNGLMTENPQIMKWGKTVLQNELLQKSEKELSIATLALEERLLYFHKKFPQLESLVPHEYIASYLGIEKHNTA